MNKRIKAARLLKNATVDYSEIMNEDWCEMESIAGKKTWAEFFKGKIKWKTYQYPKKSGKLIALRIIRIFLLEISKDIIYNGVCYVFRKRTRRNTSKKPFLYIMIADNREVKGYEYDPETRGKNYRPTAIFPNSVRSRIKLWPILVLNRKGSGIFTGLKRAGKVYEKVPKINKPRKKQVVTDKKREHDRKFFIYLAQKHSGQTNLSFKDFWENHQ